MKFRQIGNEERTRYFVDGRQVEKAEFDRLMAEEKAGLPQIGDDPEMTGNRPWSRPIVSDALQVHPRQVQAVRERNAKHGLDVEYRPDGKPVLRDRAQRRKLLRIEGKHDNQGGYSD